MAPPPAHPVLLLALLLVASVVGCATEPDQPTPAAADAAPVIARSVDPELLQPLTALGPCDQAPAASAEVGDVDGLYLPDGALVTGVDQQDPLTHVDGWIPLTPIEIRVAMANHPDVDVLNVEDEIWESETLATDGQRRLFLKAQAICERASIFVAIISPEDGSEPAPLGRGGG